MLLPEVAVSALLLQDRVSNENGPDSGFYYWLCTVPSSSRVGVFNHFGTVSAIVGVWFGACFCRCRSFTQTTDYQDLRWPRRLVELLSHTRGH